MDTAAPATLDDQLRAWARGVYPTEAAVELLIRTGWTRRGAFVRDCIADADTSPWLDIDELGAILRKERDSDVMAASGGELKVLRIAYSLAGNGLATNIPGLDRKHVSLILAAIAHAAGTHEQNAGPTADPAGRWSFDNGDGTSTRVSFPRLGSLYPWPDED